MKKIFHSHIERLVIVVSMTGIMAFVATVAEMGFAHGWFQMFLKSFFHSLPVAYVAAMIVIPFAQKLGKKLFVGD